jgi:chromosome segregation ATPase
MTKLKLLVALAISITISLPASAKMYKWVDDKGTTHYGETIPPEYANKDRTELKAGRVVEKKEVLTPEERRANEQAEAKKRVADEAALEAKRRDKALVNTYSNEKEIDLARSRNLQQIDARVNSINSQIKTANGSLQGFQKEADGFTKAGKPIPQTWQEDLKESQARLDKLKQDLEKATAEKTTIEARYDADKARYKELTGK